MQAGQLAVTLGLIVLVGHTGAFAQDFHNQTRLSFGVIVVLSACAAHHEVGVVIAGGRNPDLHIALVHLAPRLASGGVEQHMDIAGNDVVGAAGSGLGVQKAVNVVVPRGVIPL